MIVDCMSCPVRGTRCDDCVVSVLLSSAELPLDPAERQAVSVLVGAGLVRAAQPCLEEGWADLR